jgi:hypothetical protein
MQGPLDRRERLFHAWCADYSAIHQSLERIRKKTERLLEGELTEENLTAIEMQKQWILCLEEVLK